MTDAAPAAATLPEPVPSPAFETSPGPFRAALGRLSDRLNPIFIRETLQSLNGRAFAGIFALALIGVAVVAVVTLDGDAAEDAAVLGGRAFDALLRFVFLPLTLIYIPFQSFGSMRTEMQGGTAELLLLSDLTPGRIVRGRVYATMGQFGLWTAVFAPMIALTYLLRGVSLDDIFLSLAVAALFGLVGASAMTVFGAFSRWKPAAALANALAGVGLAMAGLGMIAGFPELIWELRGLLDQPDGWRIAGIALLAILAGVLLLLLTATSQLVHPNENRSTPFRLYFVGLVATAYAYAAWASPAGSSTETMMIPGVAAVFFGIPFFLFPATEEERFSPRVRILVPQNRFLALLATPLLPGRGRGFLFLLLALGAVSAVNALLAESARAAAGTGASASAFRAYEEILSVGGMGALYVVIYAGIGSLLRGVLPRGTAGNWIARIAILVLLVAFCVGPLVFVAVVLERRPNEWSPLHVLNPFFTIGEMHRSPQRPLHYLIPVAAVTMLLNLPALWRGVAETLAASKARRDAAA